VLILHFSNDIRDPDPGSGPGIRTRDPDPESGSAIRKNDGSGSGSGSALNQCGSETLPKILKNYKSKNKFSAKILIATHGYKGTSLNINEIIISWNSPLNKILEIWETPDVSESLLHKRINDDLTSTLKLNFINIGNVRELTIFYRHGKLLF
jgi:hypothetical protein